MYLLCAETKYERTAVVTYLFTEDNVGKYELS